MKEHTVHNHSRRAFTLIELIIVIVVLGILATIAIVGYKAVIDRTNSSSALSSAQALDRQIRSMAGSGDTVNNNPNDNDPRKPELLLEMIYRGDIPDQFIASTNLRNNNLRVLMWQPGTAPSSSWTRLHCPSGSSAPCTAIDFSATSLSLNSGTGAITFVGGHLTNPTRSNPANAANQSPICLQFHKAGQNVFMSISSSSRTASTISTSISTACPAATYGNQTSSTPQDTAGTYRDLSTTAAVGTAVTDPTW